jgi:hypothetical protein
MKGKRMKELTPTQMEANSRPFMLVTLSVDHSRDTGCIGYSCVIPGRSGALRRFWRTPHGMLTQADLTDFVSSLAKTCEDCVVAWVGTQEMLPMA